MSLVSDWEALDGYIFPGVDIEKPITENSGGIPCTQRRSGNGEISILWSAPLGVR